MSRPRREYLWDRGTTGPPIIGQEPGLNSALGSMNLNNHCYCLVGKHLGRRQRSILGDTTLIIGQESVLTVHGGV